MASERGRALPKFGEWDVNNPASAEGFTVIFSKASDEKRTGTGGRDVASAQRNDMYSHKKPFQRPPKKSWFCCG